MNDVKIGTIYLLHFDEPYIGRTGTRKKYVQHYTGWARNLDKRLRDHHNGNGANLMRVIKEAGIGFTLARTWTGTRERERSIKRQGGARRYCPMCGVKPKKVT